jgi:hypothetical protein
MKGQNNVNKLKFNIKYIMDNVSWSKKLATRCTSKTCYQAHLFVH